jgi:multiple sugar transport system permease protein
MSSVSLARTGGRKAFAAFVRRSGPGYAFLLPGFVVFTAVMLWPTVQAFVVSLQHWSPNPAVPNTWVGLANYARALHDPIVGRALVNSGAYMLVTVVGQMVLGLICAIALNSAIAGRAAFRVMIYVPVITSWVVVSILFKYLFQGDDSIVNYALGVVGQPPVNWFLGRWTSMVVICVLGVWKGVGWTMLIFLAALQAVPQDLYEVAQVDGAGVMAQFWHITLPSIRRTTFFIGIMLVIGALDVFISVSLVTKGGPANLTQVPLLYLYQQAFNFLDFGYGSAIAFLLTAIIFVLSVAQFSLGERNSEGAAA